ncbi:MAG: glycosyltransferase family 2 protein [candidate division Zixibacteria bacterium]|nr:glycosyltransferase family 2 protein [candidate division Zixibacteria bacterium]NIR63725.1 glycosyltransferase family 2 protein [candidate division Zixibacteria bacterium]NIS14682.1 glycosyltransferase family 2 protein [candidate division Zixibacteria bacterium]NIS45681.1 glycosyltransferase family 2 protein [candidate division Zixibacteria bacterium]NIT51210.1 glycosyltransferase family 2 protein [candidate division Zixibacteria bacterium]
MKILVLIPAYKASDTLPELVERINEYVKKEHILIVEDGSPDNTYDVAVSTGAVVLRHEVNRGKGEALKTGFKYALQNRYAGIISIDADLQHDPALIPEFIRVAEEQDADVIIGTRERNLANMPFERFLTNELTSLIISCFSGRFVRDSQSGYRYTSRRALRAIKLRSSRYDTESEFLFKSGQAGFKVWEIKIPTIYSGSESHINPLVDTGRFVRLMWKSLIW